MTTPCEACYAEEATMLWDRGADYAFWTGEPRHEPVCETCWHRRVNWEPPEPDGEAFRGGEAAAFQREQQLAAQRLK